MAVKTAAAIINASVRHHHGGSGFLRPSNIPYSAKNRASIRSHSPMWLISF
jgi:hypothetical protein